METELFNTAAPSRGEEGGKRGCYLTVIIIFLNYIDYPDKDYYGKSI